ncbi:diguanylate cyclase [Clostridia bacterium]|nr:diguanylate cyclase [Clostridia bacterium]
MKKERRNILLLSIIITVVVFFSFIMQYNAYRGNLESLGRLSLESYQNQMRNMREMTMNSTELILKEIIATPDVEKIMFDALKADGTSRVFYKNELKKIMMSRYLPNLSDRYRAIIFHLADGTTLYAIDEFGEYEDIGTDKVLMELVNRSEKAIYGYEDDRAFGGMRYLYPIVYEDEYVGAIEFCITSFQQYLEMRENVYCTCAQIISSEYLDNKTSTVDWDEYQPSPVDGYFLDKNFAEAILNEPNLDWIETTGEDQKEEILSQVPKHKDFVVSERIGGRYFSLIFLSFSTVDGEHVGYDIFFDEHEQAGYIYQVFLSNSALLLILWILVLTTLTSVQHNREVQQKLSGKDHLTQVGNRSKLDEAFARESHRVDRYGGVLSMIIFDIDDFKKINDQHGHLAGDKILKEVSALINKTIRSTDILVRWGGDEFIILLPGITLEQARRVAVKIQGKVANYVPSVKGLDMVFISVGSSEYKMGEKIDTMVQRADREMYLNKQNKDERYDKTFI